MSAPLTGWAACRASWSTTTWVAREGCGRGGGPVTDRRTGDPDRRARGRAPQRWPTTPASAHDHDEGGVGRRAVALPAGQAQGAPDPRAPRADRGTAPGMSSGPTSSFSRPCWRPRSSRGTPPAPANASATPPFLPTRHWRTSTSAPSRA